MSYYSQNRFETKSVLILFLVQVFLWCQIFFCFSGGKLVDPSPAIEKEMKTELEKLEKQYGGGSGVDMTSFPSFKFEEPKLDPINEQAAAPKKWTDWSNHS